MHVNAIEILEKPAFLRNSELYTFYTKTLKSSGL